MKRKVYIAIGAYYIGSFVLTTFYELVLNGVGHMQGSPAYIAGRIVGEITWLLVAGVLFYKAFAKQVCTCKKCNRKIVVGNNGEDKFGNPFFRCEECGEITYNSCILEPALLSESVLANLRNKYTGQGRVACLFLVIVVCVNIFLRESVLGIISFLLAIVLFIFLVIWENKESKAFNFDAKIRESILRLETDEAYLAQVIEVQGVARSSEWKKYKANTDATSQVELITEEERKELFADVWSIDVKKKERMWLFVLVFGVIAFVTGCVGLIRDGNALKEENFVHVKETDAEYEKAFYDVEGLLGPAAYTETGYVYIAMDGEDVALVYIEKSDAGKYQSYVEWLQYVDAVKPDKIRVYGYSEIISEALSDVVLQVLNLSYGDIFSEDMMPELFGKYILIVQDTVDMHVEYIYEGVVAFFISGLLISLAVALFLDAKKRNKL